jgi:sialate O-acetylesterase
MKLLAIALLLLVINVSTGNIIRMSAEERDEFRLWEKLMKKEAPRAVTFSLAKNFNNHMVLQRSPARASIYGFSPDIGQTVVVSLVIPSNTTYNYQTTVNPGTTPGVGEWIVLLDAVNAGTTVTITAQSAGTTLTLNDVIFGDVWLCSGQSNMEFTTIMMLGADAEIADAHNYPNIRLMTVSNQASDTPLDDLIAIQQTWTSPSNTSVGGPAWVYFSAVCWLYGKAIHKVLGVPIGLVATDWGGTPVEAWSSPAALAKCGVSSSTKVKQPDSFMKYVNKLPAKERQLLVGPNDNSALWNSMIHPFLKMTIYGAIWYQGESDSGGTRMDNYNCTFPTMISDWRKNFNSASGGQTNATFPFGFVQLAPNAPSQSITQGFPDIRWHQTADHGYVPNPDMVNVFMAVAMDLPDFDSTYGSIHPRDKQDIGIRLGFSGLAVAYGKSEVFQGPYPVTSAVTAQTLKLVYGDTWNLEIRNSSGFELECANNQWVAAPIVASDKTTVTLQYNVCPSGESAAGIRYAWRESPCAFKNCAVYESVNGLPGPPFLVAGAFTHGSSYFKFDSPVHV